MDRADGFDPPERGAGGGKAFADAKKHPARQQRGNRQHRHRLQHYRQQREGAAEQTADDPEANHFFRAPDIGSARRAAGLSASRCTAG